MFSKENYLPEMFEIGSILQEKRLSLNLSIEIAANLSNLLSSDILAMENCDDIYNIQVFLIYLNFLNLKFKIN